MSGEKNLHRTISATVFESPSSSSATRVKSSGLCSQAKNIIAFFLREKTRYKYLEHQETNNSKSTPMGFEHVGPSVRTAVVVFLLYRGTLKGYAHKKRVCWSKDATRGTHYEGIATSPERFLTRTERGAPGRPVRCVREHHGKGPPRGQAAMVPLAAGDPTC